MMFFHYIFANVTVDALLVEALKTYNADTTFQEIV